MRRKNPEIKDLKFASEFVRNAARNTTETETPQQIFQKLGWGIDPCRRPSKTSILKRRLLTAESPAIYVWEIYQL